MRYNSILLSLIIFLIYLEYSPNLGNIWYRIDSTGNRKIMIKGAISVILYPFKNITLWYPNNWDLNYFVYLYFTNFLLNIFFFR